YWACTTASVIGEKARPLIDMVDPSVDLAAIAETVRRLPELTDIDDLMKLLVAGNYDAAGQSATIAAE
ncbi:MAG: hypothetical protein VW709_05245, partial [Rickettsiales bacterium]